MRSRNRENLIKTIYIVQVLLVFEAHMPVLQSILDNYTLKNLEGMW